MKKAGVEVDRSLGGLNGGLFVGLLKNDDEVPRREAMGHRSALDGTVKEVWFL